MTTLHLTSKEAVSAKAAATEEAALEAAAKGFLAETRGEYLDKQPGPILWSGQTLGLGNSPTSMATLHLTSQHQPGQEHNTVDAVDAILNLEFGICNFYLGKKGEGHGAWRCPKKNVL
jgi:hypothetical protein